MTGTTLSRELAFVVAQRQIDETMVLAQAVRKGIRILYRDALIEAYLTGSISRDVVQKELGPKTLEEIEYQRDALRRDVTWGLRDG